MPPPEYVPFRVDIFEELYRKSREEIESMLKRGRGKRQVVKAGGKAMRTQIELDSQRPTGYADASHASLLLLVRFAPYADCCCFFFFFLPFSIALSSFLCYTAS